MVYEWKSSSRMKADATAVGNELEALGKEITPAAVVAAARKNKRGELHKCFDWNDTTAAEKYRLDQARYMLRMIVVREDMPSKEKPGETTAVQVRAYECVIPDPRSDESRAKAYVPTRHALAVPDLRSQVLGRLDDTLVEAQQTIETYSYLIGELSEVGKNISAARRIVKEAREPKATAPTSSARSVPPTRQIRNAASSTRRGFARA